jgi:hypothetical protein
MRRAGLLLALLLAGCATAEPPRAPSERRCAPGAEAPTPLPPRDPAAREALIALGHARETAEVAEAIGAAPALRRLATLPPGAALERLRLRQEVTEAILQGLLDAAAAMAEIDCEGERVDELRARLQRIQEVRARQLGVAGLMAGAATAALTGGLALAGAGTAGNIAGIAGGGLEAGLAGALLFGPSPTGLLETRRNLLAEVWEAPATPRLLPAPVWRHLNGPPGPGPSRLDRLRAEWAEMLGEPGSEEAARGIALQFGPGGAYTAEDLERRDRMLDLLESAIALMHRDLRRLLAEWRGGGATARPARGSAPAAAPSSR